MLNVSQFLELHEIEEERFGIYRNNPPKDTESVELFLYFTNPLNFALPLFQEFQEQMEYNLFRQVTFVPEISAIIIKANKYEDFTKYGIKEFMEEREEDLASFEGNMAFINACFLYSSVCNALWWFKLFYGRNTISF